MANNTIPAKRKCEDSNHGDRLSKLARLTTANTVAVSFAEDIEDKCIVHRDIICESSGTFRSAREALLPSEELETFELPDEHPQVFQQYVDCLYSQPTELELNPDDSLTGVRMEAADCEDPFNERHKMCHNAVELWTLGNSLEDARFQDEVMRNIYRLRTTMGHATRCKALRDKVFDYFSLGCALQRLFLYLMERRLAVDDVEMGELDHWPRYVMLHLMKRLATTSRRCRCDSLSGFPKLMLYLVDDQEEVL